MKKGLLKLLFGLGIFVVALGVNAETIDSVEGEGNSTSTDVTVGEVDESIYSATITWENLVFDYKYNEEKETFEWINTDGSVGGAFISITDTSIAGEIVPSVKWTSETKYENVLGNFSYDAPGTYCEVITNQGTFVVFENEGELYSDNTCSTKVESGTVSYEEGKYFGLDRGTVITKLETEQIPDNGRFEDPSGVGIGDIYYIYLSLENDPNKTLVKPTKGDKIGALTISIAARQ